MRFTAAARLALVVQACGGEKSTYWVEGKASFGLQASYREMARRPFQPIYVALLAQVQPPRNQALRVGHTGNIRVDSVLTARTAVPATCKIPAPDE